MLQWHQTVCELFNLGAFQHLSGCLPFSLIGWKLPLQNYWVLSSKLHAYYLSQFCVLTIVNIWRLNTLRMWQNGCHFADNIFKCIFLNEDVWFSIEISLKTVPEVPISTIPALVQIMAWRRPGDKPSSESMMVSLLMHVCVTQPQWVNKLFISIVVADAL